jgi:SAM-dependent methyltransferase
VTALTNDRPQRLPSEPCDDESLREIEEVSECPVCHSEKLVLLFLARDTLHSTPGEWGIHACRACGLMLTSPRPSPAAIASYYPEDYQPFHAPHIPVDRQTMTSSIKRVVRRLLDPREHVLPQGIVPGRALEVGCGSGRHLKELAVAGWSVEGLEPSAETAARLREETGIPITTGTIEEICFERKSFDLIVALMVLEHLHDPLECLSRIHSWLRPGGFLTGSVPNAASWEFRFFRENWFALQVPTHLFHFTPSSLTRVLSSAGFSDIRIYHQRNVSNLMVHAGHFLRRHRIPGARSCLDFPVKGPRALRLTVWPAAALLAWFGQAGRISFTARKRNSR